MTIALAAVASCLLRLGATDALGVYELELRTEVRLRAIEGSAPAREAEVTPRLALGVADRRYDLMLAYDPQLAWRELAGGDVRVLHAAALTGSLNASRNWRSTFRVDGTYGLADLTRPAPAQGVAATPEPVPATTPIATRRLLDFGSASALVSLEGRPAPRQHLRASLGASVDGGVGESASTLPVERDVRATAALGWDVTRRVSLSTDARVRAAWLTGEADDLVAALEESYHLAFGARAAPDDEAPIASSPGDSRRPRDREAWAAAGAGIGRERRADTTRFVVAPALEVGYRHAARGARIEGEAWARVGPESDRLTAAVYERLDVSATLRWRPMRDLGIDLSASGGRVVRGDQAGQTVATAWLGAAWAATSALALNAGIRSTQQTFVTVAPSFHDWTFYVGVTARERQTF